MIEGKFSRAVAQAVADDLVNRLAPYCTRILAAGSLRRGKPEVSDVEICYVSRTVPRAEPGTLFGTVEVSLADEIICNLLTAEVLSKRPNVKGQFTWGPQNKLAVHVASGVPVDLFATTAECWPNYIVCRTGSAQTNLRIAQLARARGLCWHPYGSGFSRADGSWLVMGSERQVFETVGLPYLEPEDR